MGGLAPALVRLEETVLQHELAGVGPIVRDARVVVVGHDVRPLPVLDTDLRRWVLLAVDPGLVPSGDEAVHLAAIDVALRGRVRVRPALADVLRCQPRASAPLADFGIRNADL